MRAKDGPTTADIAMLSCRKTSARPLNDRLPSALRQRGGALGLARLRRQSPAPSRRYAAIGIYFTAGPNDEKDGLFGSLSPQLTLKPFTPRGGAIPWATSISISRWR